MEHGFNGFTLLNKMSVIILILICHTAGLMLEMLEVLVHRVNGLDRFFLEGINSRNFCRESDIKRQIFMISYCLI